MQHLLTIDGSFEDGDIMVFCGKCGTSNPDDSIYCRKCGVRLYVEPTPEEEPTVEPTPMPITTPDKNPESKENRKRLILLVGSIAILALLILGIAVAEGSNWEHDTSDNIPSTPDGLYTYNVVVTKGDTTVKAEATIEVRNDKMVSATFNGSNIPIDSVSIPSKVNVSKKWGGFWSDGSVHSSTVYRWEGIDAYYLSDGKIVCIKSVSDDDSMTMTLKGYNKVKVFDL